MSYAKLRVTPFLLHILSQQPPPVCYYLVLGQDSFQRSQIHGGHSQAPVFVIVVAAAATATAVARVSHRRQVHLHV